MYDCYYILSRTLLLCSFKFSQFYLLFLIYLTYKVSCDYFQSIKFLYNQDTLFRVSSFSTLNISLILKIYTYSYLHYHCSHEFSTNKIIYEWYFITLTIINKFELYIRFIVLFTNITFSLLCLLFLYYLLQPFRFRLINSTD